MSRFRFDFDKALEAILYIAQRIRAPTFHKVSKVLYFGDLMHLERYGRFITGDRYIAMEYGPVPSGTNDIMRAARGEARRSRDREAIVNAFQVPGRYTIRPLRDARLPVFSRSDLECLDRSIELHGHKTFGQLADESHDAAWHATAEGKEMPLAAIVAMLPNPDELLEHLELAEHA